VVKRYHEALPRPSHRFDPDRALLAFPDLACHLPRLRSCANRLPHGTCRVSVYRTLVVQHIYGAIQEYADFERPEWLD
jgi:hypothetical protein